MVLMLKRQEISSQKWEVGTWEHMSKNINQFIFNEIGQCFLSLCQYMQYELGSLVKKKIVSLIFWKSLRISIAASGKQQA